MFKKRVFAPLVLILVLVALAGIVQYQLNNNFWWAKTLTKHLNASNKELKVREIVIDDAHVDFIKGVALFQGVAIKLKISSVSYFLSVGKCRIENILALLNPKAILNVDVNHLALVSDSVNASDVGFEGKVILVNRAFDSYEGNIETPSLMYNQVAITDLRALIHGDSQTVKISKIDNHFYGGKVLGDVLIGLGEDNNLSVNINFNGVDLSLMEPINQEVFSQMHGLIDGQVQLTSKQGHVTAFRGRAIAPKGGIIKAELLKFLAQYVPQRAQIEALIAQQQMVPLDKAQLETVSFNDEKFASQIRLFSSQLNLDMNITLDINIDGGFKALMKYAGILGDNL